MATSHSGYELDASKSSSARRYSTYIEHGAIEGLRNTADTSENSNTTYSPTPMSTKTAEGTIQPTHTTQPSTPQPASIYESNIELTTINPTHDANSATEVEFSLPPVDGGKDAWLFLLSAFVLEVLVWGNTPPSHTSSTRLTSKPGFPFAYGIFQDHYTTQPPFSGQRNIAIIGTCAMGLMYLSAPLVFGLLNRFPNARRPCIMAGLIIMCLALGLSSLSQTVPQLIVTQGVFYAVGGALCYSPAITFMDEWFVKRKGAAFGVMWVCSDPQLLFFSPPP
jgi:hypothetical protein